MSDYEFKNTALAKLYEKFMNNGPWLTVTMQQALDEAFSECDEKLADIQDQCDHWKTMYGNACGDQDVLKESIRLLDTENRRLNADRRIHCETIDQLRRENDELKKRCEDLRKHNVDVITVNNKTIDQLRKDNEAMKHVIDDFVEKVNGKDDELQGLQRENNELNKDCTYMTNSRDTWRSRAKHAEKEVEDLNKRNEAQRHVIDDFVTKVDELTKDRDRKAEAVVKLAKRRDDLQEKNEELQQRLMKTTDILEKTNRDRNEWKRRALMTKLTSKLPDIKEEYTMTVTMDNADYNDLMKLLWNKSFGASPEYMRTFLHGFCGERGLCNDCPLSDIEHCHFDTMSDEDIEKYYKIAIRCNT